MLILIGKKGRYFKEHFITKEMISSKSETNNILKIELKDKTFEQDLLWIANFLNFEFCVWYSENGKDWIDVNSHLQNISKQTMLVEKCTHPGCCPLHQED
jgi:hypothetical protein